jgi:hypothetical protein
MAEVDGQSQRLVMKEAQIVALAAAPVPPPVLGNPVPGAPAIASGAPPVDEDLQARRNRIIEELRRRRALRMSGQPPPPTVPVQQ